MKLYLVRHGDALSKQMDPERSLSPSGQQEVSRVARVLAGAGIKVSEVRHSGKRRAAQTAQILSAALDAGEPVEQTGLKPSDPVAPIISQLAEHQGDLMLVGHLPFMAEAAAALLGPRSAELQVDFEAGGVVCLQREIGGSWVLQWMLIPSLLPAE